MSTLVVVVERGHQSKLNAILMLFSGRGLQEGIVAGEGHDYSAQWPSSPTELLYSWTSSFTGANLSQYCANHEKGG